MVSLRVTRLGFYMVRWLTAFTSYWSWIRAMDLMVLCIPHSCLFFVFFFQSITSRSCRLLVILFIHLFLGLPFALFVFNLFFIAIIGTPIQLSLLPRIFLDILDLFNKIVKSSIFFGLVYPVYIFVLFCQAPCLWCIHCYEFDCCYVNPDLLCF